MKKAILFDLDGTVLASQIGIFHSIAYALTRLGLPIPPDTELMSFLGPPLADGLHEVCHVPVHQVNQAVSLYREYYNPTGKFEAEIYDGMREVLEALKRQGKRCYITTSKPHVFAKEILSHFGMLECFDGVYGSEFDGTRGKKSEVLTYCMEQERLSPDEVVLVGDRHFDVNGAKAVRIDCVGVVYGYGSEEELRTAGATYIAQSTADLQNILTTL